MRKIIAAMIIVVSLVSPKIGLAQNPFLHPPGFENVQGTIITRHDGIRVSLTYSAKWVHLTSLVNYYSEGEFQAPTEAKIVYATFKANDANTVLILLSNGNIVMLNYFPSPPTWKAGKTIVPSTNFVNAQKIIGDAVYVLKDFRVYASSDTAKTWVTDTAKIASEYVQDITVDTSYNAWIITQSRNLYYQHPDSNVWHKNTSFTPTLLPQAIFVDRKGRMFVSTNYSDERVWMSTNKGASWKNTSDSITKQITAFGDDAFGNVYAVGGGSAYRLSNLTPPWVSISDSIKAFVNSISGDSTLYAATGYGMYHSKDAGINWVRSPDALQLPAHNFYTGVVKAGNYYFLSTTLGIHRIAAGDTVWEKIFPQQGYLTGINNLSSDSAGNIYSNLSFKITPTTARFYNAKSTDYGNTWIPDTIGQAKLGINAGTQALNFSVDRQGMQFLSASGKLYSKRPGQSWKMDTTGIGLKPSESVSFISMNNKKGIIYLCRTYFTTALKFVVYKRAIVDTSWQVVDTSPLAANDGNMVSDQNGNIVVKTFTTPYKICRYDGNAWTQQSIPQAVGLPLTFTVDKDGVIWGAFQANAGPNIGVYYSTNSGSSWTYAGLNGVGIKFLNAVDETINPFKKSTASTLPTVYAVTNIDGVYGFSTSSTQTSVIKAPQEIPATFELLQNYPNPFNPTTTISFAVPQQSFVTIKIFDILGREIAMVLNEEKKAGVYSVTFNGTNISSGVYFYSLKARQTSKEPAVKKDGGQAWNFIQTKKLILQK